MSNSDKILRKIADNAKKIRGFGATKVGLFGSFAGGRPNSKSDVDILVEFRKGEKTFDHYMDLKFFLEKIFRRKVDLVLESALKPRLRPAVLSSVKYAPGL